MDRPYRCRCSPTAPAPPWREVVVVTDEEAGLSLLVHLARVVEPALVLACNWWPPRVVIVRRRVGS
jgi:hypothetical protein